jgi:hypothetical protein
VFHKIGLFNIAIDVHPYWDRSFDQALAWRPSSRRRFKRPLFPLKPAC